MVRLTLDQRSILRMVGEYVDAPTSRQVADRIERPKANSRYWSFDQVDASLRRMAKRGLVVADSRRRITGC